MIVKSFSEIATYKRCRRRYFLTYREQLQPIAKSEALETGSSYHEKIAEIIKTGSFEPSGDKTDAMAEAWMKYVLPIVRPVMAETRFEKQIADAVQVIGYVDATDADGVEIEHKTTSVPVDEKYIYRLQWDDQISMYMLQSGKREMWYTVIQKPSIRQKQNETMEQYVERCRAWYEDGTDTKVRAFKVHRTDADIEEYRQEVVKIAHEMEFCAEFYRNPAACQIMGCPYESICLNYDPRFVVGFEKREARKDADNQGE